MTVIQGQKSPKGVGTKTGVFFILEKNHLFLFDLIIDYLLISLSKISYRYESSFVCQLANKAGRSYF